MLVVRILILGFVWIQWDITVAILAMLIWMAAQAMLAKSFYQIMLDQLWCMITVAAADDSDKEDAPSAHKENESG